MVAGSHRAKCSCPPLFRKLLHSKAITLLVSLLSSDPCLHPASVWTVLSLLYNWVSKLQILGLPPCGPTLILCRDGSSHAFVICRPVLVVTGLGTSSEFTTRQSRETAPKLTALNQCSCSYAWEHYSTLVPPILLEIQGILSLCCPFPGLSPSPPEHFKAGTTPAMADFLNFWFCALLLVILCGNLCK